MYAGCTPAIHFLSSDHFINNIYINASTDNANASTDNANVSTDNANVSTDNANVSTDNANVSSDNASVSSDNANVSTDLEDPPSEETVKSHIKSLRHKLREVGAPNDFIDTVHGLGYRLKQL